MNARYESAKAIYASYGVDTEKVIETLKNVPVSMAAEWPWRAWRRYSESRFLQYWGAPGW